MRNGTGRDVLKVWLYAAVVVVLAAWTSPLLYNAGKAMGEVTVGKQTNGFLNWLGALCREAEFPRFFVVTLGAVAVLLFLPFSEWLDMKRGGRGAQTGQPLRKNPRGFLEFVTGGLLAGSLMLLTGYGLMSVGGFLWLGTVGSWKWLPPLLPWIVLGVLLQEWLLRGAALGIFLRAMSPMKAILLMALLSACVHLLSPPPGINVADPDADGIGFELLKVVGKRLADPRVAVSELLPLLAMGGVLGYARWRTASLWLPIGLNLGWQLANEVFQRAAKPIPQSEPLAALLSGPTLTEGLIPLAGVMVVGALVYFLTNTTPEEADEIA